MPDAAVDEARLWLRKAVQDLDVVRLLAGRADLADTTCFHAQQCVEKLLKAYLVFRRRRIERTHDLRLLVEHCRELDDGFAAMDDLAITLNPWSVQGRYPGAGSGATPEDARLALTTAEQALAFVRERIPGGPA